MSLRVNCDEMAVIKTIQNTKAIGCNVPPRPLALGPSYAQMLISPLLHLEVNEDQIVAIKLVSNAVLSEIAW